MRLGAMRYPGISMNEALEKLVLDYILTLEFMEWERILRKGDGVWNHNYNTHSLGRVAQSSRCFDPII